MRLAHASRRIATRSKGEEFHNPAPSACSRRYSMLIPALIPLINSVGQEARLWRDEATLYGRRVVEAVKPPLPSSPAQNASSAGPPIDAEFASAYLKALRDAAGDAVAAFDQEVSALETRELPSFRAISACGHCGDIKGPAGLADRSYFDFQAYIRAKALLRVTCRVRVDNVDDQPDVTSLEKSRLACIDAVRLAVGERVLAHVFAEIEAGDAEAAGIAPSITFLGGDDLLSTSPDLDSIRRGLRALLKYLKSSGFMKAYGFVQAGISLDEFEVRVTTIPNAILACAGLIAAFAFVFFGASKNEERNHEVWERGEPAFLKYWLVLPADIRSSAALQAEEGASFGPVSAAVAAYLHRCGVDATSLQRLPSLSDPTHAAEQWTLRRFKRLPTRKSNSKRGYAAWKPDSCPSSSLGEETDCY